MNKKKYNVVESCVMALTIISVGFVLSKIAQVAIPLMLAFLISLVLAPLMEFGIKRRIPSSLMAVFVLLMIAAVFFPLGLFLASRTQGILDVLPGYHNQLLKMGESFLDSMNIPRDFLTTFNWQNTIGRYISGMTSFLLDWVNTSLMVTIFLLFMLMEYPNIEMRLNMAFRGEKGDLIRSIVRKIVFQISSYLRTLTIISFITGLCVWAVLQVIGVNFPLTWGVFAFIFNFIPNIGSILASIPPILVALVQFYPDWVPVLLTFLSLTVIQFTLGNIITPKVMGDALGLSPIVILISLLFWGLIWGFSGALLAVPLTVVFKISCENIPQLHFISVLISSNPRDNSKKNKQE